MQIVLGTLLGLLLAAISALIIYGSGYRLAPKTLRLGFMDFDAKSFAALSPVQVFAVLSRAIIAPSSDASDWLSAQQNLLKPVLLIHLGWRLVCDTFVERYTLYPTEDNVRAKISDLGAQNVEFILVFERVHAVAVRDSDAIDAELAKEYFLRAPSLAQRIHPDRDMEPSNDMFERVYQAIALLNR
ncbi:hypothetical protein [Sphingomonas sp. NIBR02145]|uniref:hypothetical protein n=1 Tax=Sphingomonas sp. NIBR02145 TaxID=3014784 RepID=UPI0022B577C0|nr:hypothetical protein [Sphingomonas sp. NIBR02145]WHU01480.1 hypothetical protein O3305_14880 [Sphingomonas sp. NIBR02145]